MSAFGAEIPVDQIRILGGGLSKKDALNTLIDAVAQNPAITDAEAFREAVHAREAVMSTGIGGGIAIPHVRIPQVQEPTLGAGIAPEGLEFATLDNKPVYILILFATPQGADKEYLGLLAQVMHALRDEELFERLVKCKTSEEVHEVLGQ